MRVGPIIAGLLLGCYCSTSIGSAEDLRIAALSGTPAPGTESGVVFRSFDSPPTLNNRGQIAFSALLSGTGIVSSYERCVWSEGDGLELIARKGAATPGTENGVIFGGNIGGVLSDNGRTVVLAELDRTAVDNTFGFGSFRKGDENGLELIFDDTSQLPGIESGNFLSGSGAFAMNSAGETAFWLTLSASDEFGFNSEGIWSEGGGNGLELIARSGSVATSNEGEIHFYGVDNDVKMNDHGQVTFLGTFSYVGAESTVAGGVWSGLDSSSLRLVARTGANAPGTESGVNFSGLEFPVSNNRGQIAFWGRLSGPNIVQGLNDIGYWSEGRGNGLELIARIGSAAPGMESGVKFKDLGTMVLNENGQTAFSGRLNGPSVGNLNDEGIWTERHGDGLELIAREGDPAPGTENGVNFGSFFLNGNTSALVLNGRGQTAFFGKLAGVGVDFRNDEGIWAEDTFGELHLIAREGDTIDVDAGPGTDLRRILRLYFFHRPGDQDGRTGEFNDLGQLAFQAAFYDGTSGLFISTLVAVPEPASGVALIFGMIVMCCRWRVLVSQSIH